MNKADQEAKVKQRWKWLSLVRLAIGARHQLSGGQQQRVAVARALVFDPELVLMDEPLGALDKQLREQMQYEIKHIHENLGVTVVYVTHDQTEALTMSDRVAVFEDGRIQQLSPPNVLYESPQNSFVAQFIGENNKLSGTVTAINGDVCEVKLDDGTMLKAEVVNVSKVGERTLISLRPERVEFDDPSKQENVVEGKILEILYLGDHLRVVMSVCGNPEFIVKVRNRGQTRPMKAGETHKIGWAAHDCKALDSVQ